MRIITKRTTAAACVCFGIMLAFAGSALLTPHYSARARVAVVESSPAANKILRELAEKTLAHPVGLSRPRGPGPHPVSISLRTPMSHDNELEIEFTSEYQEQSLAFVEDVVGRIRESAAGLTLTIVEPPSVHFSVEWPHPFRDFALGASLGVILALIMASRVQHKHAF